MLLQLQELLQELLQLQSGGAPGAAPQLQPGGDAVLEPGKLHFASINVIFLVHPVPAKLHFARKNVIFWSQELFTSKTEGPTHKLGGFGVGVGVWVWDLGFIMWSWLHGLWQTPIFHRTKLHFITLLQLHSKCNFEA